MIWTSVKWKWFTQIDLNIHASGIVLWNNTNPVVIVLFLAVMIVAVVERLIWIILQIEVGLRIRIVVQIHIGVSVLQFHAIVERNWCEWIEEVGVNWLELWQIVLFKLSVRLCWILAVHWVSCENASNYDRGAKHVHAVAHPAERRQQVRHFFLMNFIF